jgi:hypothetical protein
MVDLKGEVDVYIKKNKKNSKLNKTEVNEVVLLLKEVNLDNDASVDNVIEILLDLHYTVTAEFFKNVFTNLDDVVKAEFMKKFLSANKIVNNANNFGINRCLVIINELLKATGNAQFINTILKICSKKACGNDGGQKAGELLSKICFKDTKSMLLLLDYTDWKEAEMRNLSVWLDNAIIYTTDAEIKADYNSFIGKYNLSRSQRTDVNISTNQTTDISKIEVVNSSPKKGQKEKIVVLVSDLQLEAEKLVNERSKLTKEIIDVKSKLEQSNRDKEELSVKVSELKNNNCQLEERIRINKIQIIDYEKKIAEINESLEYAYKADKRAGNQELVSLKNDLVKQLKLDYDSFLKLASKEPEQYPMYYVGLIGIIENIFDSLRRKGIVINKEYEGNQ